MHKNSQDLLLDISNTRETAGTSDCSSKWYEEFPKKSPYPILFRKLPEGFCLSFHYPSPGTGILI